MTVGAELRRLVGERRLVAEAQQRATRQARSGCTGCRARRGPPRGLKPRWSPERAAGGVHPAVAGVRQRFFLAFFLLAFFWEDPPACGARARAG